RIQEFHSFLEHEQTGLTKDRIVSDEIVSPYKSAFIISLVASWIEDDPRAKLLIYYDTVHRGLAVLVRHKYVSGLIVDSGRVEVTNANQHQAVQNVLNQLKSIMQEFKYKPDRYWVER